jgi:hypothetical protein
MRMGSIYTIDWNPILQFFVPLLLIAGLAYYFTRRPAGPSRNIVAAAEPPPASAIRSQEDIKQRIMDRVRGSAETPPEPESKVTKSTTFDL